MAGRQPCPQMQLKHLEYFSCRCELYATSDGRFRVERSTLVQFFQRTQPASVKLAIHGI